MAAEYGKLVDEICNSTGKYIKLETGDGVNREGKLTKIELRKFMYNGRAVCLPSGIELNDDVAHARRQFDLLRPGRQVHQEANGRCAQCVFDHRGFS